MADCGEDQRKSRQDRKRNQRQKASEGIIKKVKGDDAERQLTKQQQCMANHRARETVKQRYQQVISINGSLLLVNIFVFSCQTWNCRLLASHIIHVLPCAVCTLTQLAARGFWVNLHLVSVIIWVFTLTNRCRLFCPCASHVYFLVEKECVTEWGLR